jgi:hypothetical protein
MTTVVANDVMTTFCISSVGDGRQVHRARFAAACGCGPHVWVGPRCGWLGGGRLYSSQTKVTKSRPRWQQPLCRAAVCSRSGTAAETYMLVKREMQSIGCRHIADDELHEARFKKQFHVYNFGFDQGPDNFGMLPQLHDDVRGKPNVTFNITWCILHQMHLVVKVELELVCVHTAIPITSFFVASNGEGSVMFDIRISMIIKKCSQASKQPSID